MFVQSEPKPEGQAPAGQHVHELQNILDRKKFQDNPQKVHPKLCYGERLTFCALRGCHSYPIPNGKRGW
jgi:hypothetical protein